jgi:hypothetical protein
MILQKKTINNVPTLVPLTADTGSGVPVGTIHGFYKKGSYPGYLYLDGSTFDETLYPALYAYLGTNVLPDYREFVLVGAEQNSTSATIAAHDVFTQGQEKDDQLQEHTHYIEANNLGHYDKFFNSSGGVGNVLASLQYTGAQSGAPEFRAGEFIQGRHGTTTRTKEKAVFWYIKATTGISESEATDVLNLMTNRMFPDYAHPITIPDGTFTWTATEDCYVNYTYMTTANNIPTCRLTIDGNVVGAYDRLSTIDAGIVIFSGFIKKGQTVSTIGVIVSLSRTDTIKFFPLTAN